MIDVHRWAALSVFLAATGALAAEPPVSGGKEGAQTNVILVHGAFADASSWRKVIPLLEAKNLHVVAVQLPETSIEEDVAATKRALSIQKGAVVLVGHSYGGMVITAAADDPNVRALVYVTALMPEHTSCRRPAISSGSIRPPTTRCSAPTYPQRMRAS
ncbi:MAG: alpha/beta hydrolase [Deltaproteobacteria bacterium]|nr:MAG: alpha/beta hydrolase [Deltaproteobacteria bacterium]